MSEDARQKARDAALWRRVRESQQKAVGPVAAPDALSLAAYLDGTLDDSQRRRIERWMAASPQAVDLIASARATVADLAAAPAPPAPAAVVRRAQAIVHAPADMRAREQGASRWGGLLARLSGPGTTMRPALWAGVAATVVLAAISGFEMGRLGATRLVSLETVVAGDLRLVIGHDAPDLL